MGSCIFIRKEDFRSVGGFDETVSSGEDTDLSQRLRARGYNILIDPAMAPVHLGNAQTVAEFVSRQIWHAENYLFQTANLRQDKVFLLVCLQLALTLLAVTALVVVPVRGALGILLCLNIAPGILSIKRIKRARFRSKNPVDYLAIHALDHLYLFGQGHRFAEKLCAQVV